MLMPGDVPGVADSMEEWLTEVKRTRCVEVCSLGCNLVNNFAVVIKLEPLMASGEFRRFRAEDLFILKSSLGCYIRPLDSGYLRWHVYRQT